jgi:hypothetical protein
VGDGLLLAPSANHVVAFKGTVSGTSKTTQDVTTTSDVAKGHAIGSAKSAGSAGGISDVVIGFLSGLVLLLAGVAWLLAKRHRSMTSH